MLLPAVLVVAWYLRTTSMGEIRRVEALAIDAADIVILLSDIRAESDVSALRVLSTSRFFTESNFEAAAARALDALMLVPEWNAIVLTDVTTGDTIFQVNSSGLVVPNDAAPDLGPIGNDEFFGGVAREGAFCPCVTMHATVPSKQSLVLTVYVNPQVYQDLLVKRFPDGAVAGLVDQEGNFLARSIDFAERVGTPATSYVLEAVANRGRGIYPGVTYEGLTNYSAYATSDLTGWSAHVAIDNVLIDRPRSRALSAMVIGALAAIVIGAGLFTYVIQDLATRRLEDRRLMELQKAEAMSHFTANIVHDFRNILSAMQSGLRMIMRTTSEPKIKKYAEMIEDALQRGAKLSNRLLSFARENGAEIEAVNLSELFDDLEYLLQQAAGRGIEVRVEQPDRSITVSANRDQLELALINLTVNARDAMEGSGSVVISAETDGDYVSISISDTGPGIPPELKHELFKPFFTTKPNGSGTGLGLAQVAGTVH